MPPVKPLKLLFVVNPKSGESSNEDWITSIKDYFSGSDHTMVMYELKGKNDEADIQQKINEVDPDRVIAVGGDGTVTMVAKLLKGTSIPMGILPAGSANGMAKELDIPLEPEAALDLILNGEIKDTDLLKVNDDICLHLSDIGLNAELVKYFEESNRRGKWGYARVLMKVLWKKQILYVKIETEGKVVKRKALVVIFANASKYGFGAVINPDSSIHDGYFEVVIVRRLALSELLKMWLKPQPFNPQKIEIVKAKSAEIDCLHNAHFQVDGEYKGRIKKIKATILPAVLKLILPRAAPAEKNKAT